LQFLIKNIGIIFFSCKFFSNFWSSKLYLRNPIRIDLPGTATQENLITFLEVAQVTLVFDSGERFCLVFDALFFLFFFQHLNDVLIMQVPKCLLPRAGDIIYIGKKVHYSVSFRKRCENTFAIAGNFYLSVLGILYQQHSILGRGSAFSNWMRIRILLRIRAFSQCGVRTVN
jgi:hypothetical protein